MSLKNKCCNSCDENSSLCHPQQQQMKVAFPEMMMSERLRENSLKILWSLKVSGVICGFYISWLTLPWALILHSQLLDSNS